ncbi:AMIN domain-containing protein [Spiribacter sp. 2438]|nr:AMIN domain-containing protein [Spiribacter sp. 2438]
MRTLWVLLTLLLMPLVGVAGVSVEDVRSWSGPEKTRVVFDLDGPAGYELFTLEGPDRAVLDIRNARLPADMLEDMAGQGPIDRVRTGSRGDGVRVVFDLTASVEVNSFTVEPSDGRGHRLVVDLKGSGPGGDGATDRAESTAREPTRSASSRSEAPFLVAIDPGHGGQDPGAIGPGGTYEKDVVLSVGRKLADRINAVEGMRAILIRDGDYFIGLRDRTRRARDANADLFVSLHADAFHDQNVRGSSVFVLSRTGASSEMARLLARSENRADRIGGVSLDDKDPDVASVLLDLSRAHTVEESMAFAAEVRHELAAIGDVHGRGVEQAGFAVLKSLDMPSVLVELAFITNPDEERRLNTPAYQHQLSRGILNGIRAYARNMRPDLHFGADEYVVQRGDTLSEIAMRHSVSVDSLRRANNLGNDRISAGRTLQIP